MRTRRKLLIAILSLLVILTAAGGVFFVHPTLSNGGATTSSSSASSETSASFSTPSFVPPTTTSSKVSSTMDITSSLSTTTLTETSSFSSSSPSSSTTTSLTVSSSSTNNVCFTNGYNDTDPVINALYYSCSATLLGGQSINQNELRSVQLYGPFAVTVNASQSVTVTIYENQSSVFTKTGSSITFTGSIAQGVLLSITVGNLESGSSTNYKLGIDFQS